MEWNVPQGNGNAITKRNGQFSLQYGSSYVERPERGWDGDKKDNLTTRLDLINHFLDLGVLVLP